MTKKIRVASLFTGVGGAEKGFEEAFGKENLEHVAFAEYDRFASQVLAFRWPDVKNWGDVTKIDWKTFPECDILHSSSPCTSFSVAGKRKGMEDEGTGYRLWEAYWECLKTVRPKIVTFENVAGLLSSGKGEDFRYILGKYDECGYHVRHSVMNALDHGVPQNRKRVILVGFRKDLYTKEQTDSFAYPLPQQRTKKLKDVLQPESEVDPKFYLKPEAILKLLSKMSDAQIDRLMNLGGYANPSGTVTAMPNVPEIGEAERIYSEKGVLPPLSTSQKNISVEEKEAYSQPLKFLDRNQKNYPEYAMTVDTAGTNGVGVVLNRKDGIKSETEVAKSLEASDWRGLNRNQDQVAIVINHDVIEPKESANALCASGSKGLDNHGARTGIAVVSQPHGFFKGSVNEDDIGSLRGSGTSGNQHIIALNQRDEVRINEKDEAYSLVAQEGGKQFQRVATATDRIAGWSVDDRRAIPFQGDAKRSTVQESILNTKENDSVSALSTAHAASVKVVVPADLRRDGTLNEKDVNPCLRAESKGGDDEARVAKISSAINQDAPQFDRVFDPDGVSRTLGAARGAQSPFVVVRTGDGKSHVVIGNKMLSIRKLTPIETCRLMDWTDDWNSRGIDSNGKEVAISTSQRYRQCGNGIVSSVVKAVAEQIIPLL